MRRTGRLVVLTLEGLLLLVLIAGAAYVSIGRILVANIDAFEGRIERRLSAALNVPVSFDGVAGTWDYFDPTLTITGLAIGEANRTAISTGEISARINSIATLLERAVVISELRIDGIDLDLVQDPEGGWRIAGMPSGGGGFDVSPILTSIAYLQQVDVRGVNIKVDGERHEYHLTNQAGVPMALVEEAGQKIVSMPLSFQQSEERYSEFELVGRYSGDPRDVDEFYGDLYLQLPLLELSDFLPRGAGGSTIQRLAVRGEFWLECADGRWQLRSLPVVETLVLANGDREIEVAREVTATLSAQGVPFYDVQVQLTGLQGRIGRDDWQGGDIAAALRTSGQSTWDAGVVIDGVDIGDTAARIRRIGRSLGLVDDSLDGTLAALNPRGRLNEVLVRMSGGSDDTSVRVAARLADVSLDSHRKSPVVTGIDGILVVGDNGGHFDLIDDSFGLMFPAAYDLMWRFDGGRGRLAFDLSAGYPIITSEMIRARAGELGATGRLTIKLPPEPVDRTWGLELGVVDANLAEAGKYIPDTVDAGVREWLGRSILGGHSLRSGMVFHGTLDNVAPRGSKLFELFFDVEDTTLEYDPAWPPVRDMTGRVYISNRGVFADGVRGTMLDSQFAADVDVPMGLDDPPDTIRVEGDVTGRLPDGLRVLQETPLAEATSQLAATWTGTGDYEGDVLLDIPIGSRQGEAVGASVSVELSGNAIAMRDMDLDVEDIQTMLTYETGAGLSAPDFTASLFGYPVAGHIQSEATEAGGAVEISLAGQVDVADLRAWSRQGILRAADGRFDYDAVLHVPYGNRVTELTYVEAISDLEGVSIDLPPPMAKSKDEARSFRYRQSFLDEAFRIDVDLDEGTRASLKSVGGEIVGGRIHFGGSNPGVVAYDDLEVTGHLGFVDYAEWDVASRYLEREDGSTVELAGTLDAIEVDIDRLLAFGVELDSVRARITRDPGRWRVRLENEMLSGTVSVPDDAEPIHIALDYLRMPAEEAEESRTDPLAEIDPTELAEIDFETAELVVGEDDYGRWAFAFRPSATGAALASVRAEVRGLTLTGDSRVTWNTSGERAMSRYTGDITVKDLSSAFRQWGFASSIEGKDLKLTANLEWEGSPVMIDLFEVAGTVGILEGSGRFVQAESGTGALRLLGIFDFASLGRRARLDFSDVVSGGFSFNELHGRVRLEEAILRVVDPIVIVGSGSTFKVGGTVNLETNTLDNDMVVTLPVSRNLPWYAAYSAIATGPLVGAGVWLAQKVFENQIDQMTSAKYKIEGTIDQPEVEFVSIFSDSVRESPETGEVDGSSAGERGSVDGAERIEDAESESEGQPARSADRGEAHR